MSEENEVNEEDLEITQPIAPATDDASNSNLVEVQTMRIIMTDDESFEIDVPVFIIENIEAEADKTGETFDEAFGRIVLEPYLNDNTMPSLDNEVNEVSEATEETTTSETDIKE